MGAYVASSVVKLMLQRGLKVTGGRVLVLGLTFKENCPDLRNTRVTDIIDELESFGLRVDVFDPWVDPDEAQCEYGITPVQNPQKGVYDCIILAVAHDEFKHIGVGGVRVFASPNAVLYDVKYLFNRDQTDGRL